MWDYPEPNLNPPEDNYEEVKHHETVYIDLNTDILIDSEGFWEPVDGTFPENEGNKLSDEWRDEEYGVLLGDNIDMLDYIDELMPDLSEYTPGEYRMTGEAELAFEINGIEVDKKYLGKDEDEDPIFDVDSYIDRAEVSFLKERSKLTGFKLIKV